MGRRGTVTAGLGACAAYAAYPSIGLRGELEGRVHRRLALRGIVRQWLGGGSGAGVRFSALPGGGVWYGFRAESGAIRGEVRWAEVRYALCRGRGLVYVAGVSCGTCRA